MSKLIGIDGVPLQQKESDEKEKQENLAKIAEAKAKTAARKAEVEKLLEDSYFAARENFRTDESYFKDYEDFIPEGKYALVKLFKFYVPEELKKEIGLGKTSILVESALNPSELKPKEIDVYEKVYPIVKIISVGDEIVGTEKENGVAKYKSGDLAAVRSNEIEGKKWNPDFLTIMQTFGKQGRNGRPGLVHVPDDMPQKVDALDINWERYRFTNLAKPTDTSENLVYLIPDAQLRGHLKR
jgi:hypothetical protein